MTQQPFSSKSPSEKHVTPLPQAASDPWLHTGGLFSILLLMICLFINIYVRLTPAYFPQLRQKAAQNVTQQMVSEGSLRMTDLNMRMETEYQKLKDPYQDANGLTYLMEMDPYLWARFTKNMIQHGHPGDIKKNGESYDSLMLAPDGLNLRTFYFQFLFYLSAYLFQGGHAICPSLSVDVFLLYVPVFYAAVFFLLFYFFVRRWYGDLAAFITVLLTGLSPNFIERSCVGWYDFDMLSLVMALGVAWCFLEAFARKDRLFQAIVFSLAAGFLQGLFAFTWTGWWFIGLVCLGFWGISLILDIVEHWNETEKYRHFVLPKSLLIGLFLSSSIFWICFFTKENAFAQIKILSRWLHFGTAVTGFQYDVWPNVFYSITELGTLNFSGFLTFFSSKIFAGLALCGCLVMFVHGWRKKEREVALLMLIWMLLMGYAAFKGQRFMLYFLPPFFMFLGAFAGRFLPEMVGRIPKSSYRRISGGAFFGLVSFLVWRSIASGIDYGEQFYPFVNDAWHQALNYADKNTPKNAVLNAWWDYGNWLKYYGKRRVIFDGQSQHNQLCYWMARAFLEKDEAKAISDLRLINNNSFWTYYALGSCIFDPYLRLSILEKLLNADSVKGSQILQKYSVSKTEAAHFLKLLYASPSPAYLVVDASLFQKMSAISYFSNWNFQRLFLNQNFKLPAAVVVSQLQNLWGMPPARAQAMYELAALNHGRFEDEALSRRIQFYGKPERGKQRGDLLAFGNGFLFNLRSNEVVFYSKEDKRYVFPRKVVFYDGAEQKTFENLQGDYDKVIVLVKKQDAYWSVVADPGLEDSLFLKLYLLDGQGLKRFKPFYRDEEKHIYIYEILWESGT